jgi:Uncharacterized protein conserved in bacteria C-term(DUF2220)
MTTPLWLSSKPVYYFLAFIVDKLDASQAAGKQLTRAIRLNPRAFPELFNSEFESDKERLWEYVEQMAVWGWFRIRHDKLQPGQAKYSCNPRVDVLDEAAIRAAVGRPSRILSATELWREAVYSGLKADDIILEQIARTKIEIPGRSSTEIVAQLNLLTTLRDEPLLLREASARLFWGLSKVLDKRQGLIASLLQVEECPFPEAPVQLHAYLPLAGLHGVLFIENQTTFELATRDKSGKFSDLALVFASGFKGSAKRLRIEGGASLYFSANGSLDESICNHFLKWLQGRIELSSWFWGDLDFSGMQILSSLRKSFPELEAWEPGYSTLLEILNSGGGHEPESGGKQLQRAAEATGSVYADERLIPAMLCTGKFVDQEMA